jgi:hypothetical protein
MEKVYPYWTEMVVRCWEERGEEFENLDHTQRTPSDQWLLGYLINRLIGKMSAFTGIRRTNREKKVKGGW